MLLRMQCIQYSQVVILGVYIACQLIQLPGLSRKQKILDLERFPTHLELQ